MDRRITASIEASAERTMAALVDLGTYPSWLSLVQTAEPTDPVEADDGAAAWHITLRARLGSLARSKRLRMVRVQLDERSVRFERAELDHRDHATWTLEASVDDHDSRSDVEVDLHYSGALWSTPLEVALATFEGSAAERLNAYLATV